MRVRSNNHSLVYTHCTSDERRPEGRSPYAGTAGRAGSPGTGIPVVLLLARAASTPAAKRASIAQQTSWTTDNLLLLLLLLLVLLLFCKGGLGHDGAGYSRTVTQNTA